MLALQDEAPSGPAHGRDHRGTGDPVLRLPRPGALGFATLVYPHPGPVPSPRVIDEAAVYRIERPHSKLWSYYLLCCVPLLVLPPVAVVVGLVNWFRYHTMRYRFDAEGINMRWGILFRREVILNYARIQDIHLVSNLVERWLGLARIQIQTASGSATPEMTIEGIPEFEHLRDFLYAKMRGIREHGPTPAGATTSPPAMPGNASSQDAELAAALHAITTELRALRHDLAACKSSSNQP